MIADLFSTLTTVRNGAAFVADAVDSLLAQTDPHFEIIVVNDGSTDATAAILAQYSDPRLTVLTLPPVGRVAALLCAMRHAQGELCAILDGDDIALPHRLATQRQYLQKHPEVALLGSRAIVFDSQRETVPPAPSGPFLVRRALGMYNPFFFSSVAFRRRAYDQVGGFREEDGWGCDVSLLIRIAAQYPVDILPEPLIRYRQHPAQITLSPMWDRQQRRKSAWLQLQAARQLRLPWHLWLFPLLGWVYAWLPPALRPQACKTTWKHHVLRWLGIWQQ